jgi:hypothetical protein
MIAEYQKVINRNSDGTFFYKHISKKVRNWAIYVAVLVKSFHLKNIYCNFIFRLNFHRMSIGIFKHF